MLYSRMVLFYVYILISNITQAAIFNASSGFVRKPILELTEEEFASGFAVSAYA